MKGDRLPPPRGAGTGDLFAQPAAPAPQVDPHRPDPARCRNRVCGAPWGCQRRDCQIPKPKKGKP